SPRSAGTGKGGRCSGKPCLRPELGYSERLERAKSVRATFACQSSANDRRDYRQCKRGTSMDQGPLVAEQIDAGARLAAEVQTFKPLDAAFWLRASEDGHWFLYLASHEIDDSNFDLAY